ncbi:MAG TPA: ATP-binding protein, partial [Chitinophagaceae bacterium]|nr:ATP-binding protein [Chitinophagaceae bacterium]
MKKDPLKYLALWFFLAGVIIIVFLQFISGVNINRLLQGNDKLLKEVKIQHNLRKLEADVLTLESDIRGIIIKDDIELLPLTEQKIAAIKREINSLKLTLDTNNTSSEIAVLDFLVREKIDLSNDILASYVANGKKGGETVINKGRGKEIRDSIITIVSRLDSVRQTQLKGIVGSIKNSGNLANTWGIILAAIACIACVLTFLYVVNVGRHQQQMIAKLNESEKRLKEASSAKEQFLANMSHEIRTPMNAILGFTNLLKKTKLDGQQAQYVDFIHSSGENLLALINDILDLSKIEAGMMQLENTPFSLNGLIASIETMFAEKAETKGLVLKVSADATINDTLSGDAIRLTQILINLLSNAIKFTEHGVVELNVASVKNTPDEVVLQFHVKDTGIGIAPGKKQNIFDRFQQAEAETTRRFGGTGLGLSIVKQLVEIQKGSINVISELGKGSEFIVTLPFVPLVEYTAVNGKKVAQPQQVAFAAKRGKVLIAEDNSMNQHLIRHLMEQWQVDYILVNNGWEAVEQLKENNFSLVLMDIQMPEMDGYVTTSVIRNELKSTIPIIAMTAHAMAGEREKCLGMGMNEYISKPIKENELYNIIQQYTD